MPKFTTGEVDPNKELPGLMEKLTAERDAHKEGAARIHVHEGPAVDTDALMAGLSERSGDIIAKHEAEREAARQREENRKKQHPDQFEKMQQERAKNEHI